MKKVIFLSVIGLGLFLPGILLAQVREEWVARYNGTGDSDDLATAMVVDSSCNVYVTGWSYSITGANYATVKYDTNGNELWVARYEGGFYAFAMAVDSNGNVYVTGTIYENVRTGHDYATVKYDTNGNEIWTKRYNGPALEYFCDDYASAIAVDSSSNVYVTGRSWSGWTWESGTDYDYATVKYDTNGNELWVKRYNGSGNNWDMAAAVAIDLSNNIYVTGVSYGGGTGYDYTTVKYDITGNELWVKRYNSPANSMDIATAIAVDSSDNVYVTGHSTGIGTYYDYATIKYSQYPIGETPVGTDVTVNLGSGVTVTFSSVTVTGETTLTITDTGPPPITGFKLAGDYYEISTTAVYTGPVTVTIVYDDTGMTAGQEKTLKLFHFENGVWVDVTTSLDTVNNIITGQVANLSLFAIMFELGPPGWDEGKKTGWHDENSSPGLIKDEKSPEGFDRGKKSGWGK